MKQSAFTIVTPVKPGEVEPLESLLDDIGDHIKDNAYLPFTELEDLHYASFVTVAADGTEPYLLFEGNIDGSRSDFLDELVRAAGDGVDQVYGHCVGYPSAGAQDPEAVVAYLEDHDIGTNTFFVAWPGRTVGEIKKEDRLRDQIEELLDAQGADLSTLSPEEIRWRIQQKVESDDSLAWARTVPPPPFLVANGKRVLAIVAAPPVLGLVKLAKSTLGRSTIRRATLASRLVLTALVALVGGLAARLRSEEARDERTDQSRDPDWQTCYAEWSENLGHIVQREDVQGQNHLASVTRIKAGLLRRITLRLVLWVINLAARVVANRGSLGGIASIHFARWVIWDRQNLIFLSNFDGSWESYLNDFIDLAAGGLTAVWTNTDNKIGFPRTSWLVREGARDEPRFKAYARYSQVRTRAWYSAYPDLSIANIGNNMQIREQLFTDLDPTATREWLRRL